MRALSGRHIAIVVLAVASAAGAAAALSRGGTSNASATAAAPPATLQTVALSTPLPSDPDVLTGRFDNGFRYYLRRNTQPLGRAELRLVVNAGSILEDDDQRGLAHFVEHMAFNGTTHFPKQAIASFMQSIGMRFGPSVNATTGFDETIYALQIPTDRPEITAQALQILEDWAHNVTFDPEEIDRERGVVIEEWRQRRGAAQRLQDAQTALLFKGARYAERIPIGTLDNLQHFSPARLKAFYADWYRPDLMALVAVGDFDPPEIERLARTHFAGVSMPSQPKPRPAPEVPALAGPIFGVFPDSEAAGATLAVYSRFTPPPETSVGDYRRLIVERLATQLFSTRLAESTQRPGAPLLGAGAGRTRIVRSQDVVTFRGVLRQDAIEKGVAALFMELERVARFGFTSEELERQRTITLRGFERAVVEKDTRPSAMLAAEYARHFTRGEPFPGLIYEFDLTKRFLPAVTLDEVNALATSWLPADNRAVVLSAPEKPGSPLPNQEWLARVIRVAATVPITPYVSRGDAQPLLTGKPRAGTIVKTTVRERVGITEWELSNGARVVLKPTAFKQDEVLFTAWSPGGTSLAADAEYIPAMTAPQVVSSLGVGQFSSASLRRALTGKVVGVRALIGPYEEGLAGAASERDLEALFELVYLNFTQPRRDPGTFAALTSQMRSAVANQAGTPDFAFAAALSNALNQHHLRARPMTADTIAGMNLDQSLAFYRDRFADASDFTFVFVGSFDVEEIRPLVEQYLASLPSIHRTESWRDVGIRPPSGIVEERVERGGEPKSRTAVVFTGSYTPEATKGLALRAGAEILQTRLIDSLREELGGSYTVTVGANLARIPRDEYRVTITFGSDPARTDALAARMFEEIGRLTSAGPTAAEVANVKTAMVREFETSSRQNAFVLSQLVDRYRTGEAPETLLETPTVIASLSSAAIHGAVRAALDVSRYVKVTLTPSK